MDRQDLLDLTQVAINGFDRAVVSSDRRSTILKEIPSQLKAMDLIMRSLYAPAIEKSTFDELYSAAYQFQGEYWAWIFGHYGTDCMEKIDQWVKDFGIIKTMRLARQAVHSHRVITLKENWWQVFDNVLIYIFGNMALQEIFRKIHENPDYLDNKDIFDLGNYSPFDGHWKNIGLDGERTDDHDKRFKEIFSKAARKRGFSGDDVKDYEIEAFFAISGLSNKRALQEHFKGSLKNYISKVAQYGTQELSKEVQTIKPKGSFGDFQEIANQQIEEGLTIIQFALSDSVKIPTLEQIYSITHNPDTLYIQKDFLIKALETYPTESFEHQIIKHLLDGTTTDKDFAEKWRISRETLRKKKIQISQNPTLKDLFK